MKKNYNVNGCYVVGRDDNKIHRILENRYNYIYTDPYNFQQRVILTSHSIYSDKKKHHIAIWLHNEDKISLSVSDIIIVRNHDLYIIQTNGRSYYLKYEMKYGFRRNDRIYMPLHGRILPVRNYRTFVGDREHPDDDIVVNTQIKRSRISEEEE